MVVLDKPLTHCCDAMLATEGPHDDQDEGDLYGLFICEDYVEKVWTFDDMQQPLLCSNMSSTDHDLTGQIVWPACVLLSWFIHRNKVLFIHKVVIELGAGCGLGGFVAASHSKQCIITDGNDIVCNLLHKNKEHLNAHNVRVEKLLWGLEEEVVRVLPDPAWSPDVIIGADVVLWPNQVSHLLRTIRWLLARKGRTGVCFISYIVRANTTTERLFSTAARMGLTIASVPVDSFLPADCRDFDALEKMLLRIELAEGVDVERLQAEEACEVAEDEQQMDTLARPC